MARQMRELLKRQPWVELLVLAGTIWLAHFQLFQSLGLYEDDYAFIGQQLDWGTADLLQYLKVVATLPQGRPIQFLIPRVLTVLAGHLGGIQTLYIFAFLSQAANACLFYYLLRRVGLRTSAFVGALIFALYPADTTHTFLMHALGVHPALMFLLIAAHAYLSGHRWIAHLVSAGSLLTYESAYVPFLAVPLLVVPWGSGLRRELWRHALAWLAVLVMSVALRSLLGEARIESLSASGQILQLPSRIGLGMLIGPAVSLGLLGIGPAWVVSHWEAELTLLFVMTTAIFFLVMGQLGTRAGHAEPGITAARRSQGHRARAETGEISTRQITQLLLAGAAMLSLAYALSFTHFPPTVQYGRATSVHMASAVGGSLVVACLHALLMSRIRPRSVRALATFVIAAYLSILFAYRVAIQIDFREAWTNQREFWTQVMPLVQDATDGTMVFVLNHDLPQTRFIYTNSWADPIVLAQLWEYPEDWSAPPRVFVVSSDWTRSIAPDGEGLRWEVPAATWPAHWETLPDRNVIVLEMENGHLVRRSGAVAVQDRVLRLKPAPGENGPRFPAGPLQDYVLHGK